MWRRAERQLRRRGVDGDLVEQEDVSPEERAKYRQKAELEIPPS
jgi:type IV secretory pathway VirD2 relaxase